MSKLEAKIRMLGAAPIFLEDLGLEKHAREAVKLLVEELHPIPYNKIRVEDQDTHWHEMHVVWCIRALRYLTRIDVQAPTDRAFVGVEDENRARYLNITEDHEVSFFGVRMSRDTTYPAPTDAQLGIIEKWKKWIVEEASSFEFPEPPRFSDWYY